MLIRFEINHVIRSFGSDRVLDLFEKGRLFDFARTANLDQPQLLELEGWTDYFEEIDVCWALTQEVDHYILWKERVADYTYKESVERTTKFESRRDFEDGMEGA